MYLITKIELFFFIDFFILIEKNIVFHLKYSGLADRPPAAGRPTRPSASQLQASFLHKAKGVTQLWLYI